MVESAVVPMDTERSTARLSEEIRSAYVAGFKAALAQLDFGSRTAWKPTQERATSRDQTTTVAAALKRVDETPGGRYGLLNFGRENRDLADMFAEAFRTNLPPDLARIRIEVTKEGTVIAVNTQKAPGKHQYIDITDAEA